MRATIDAAGRIVVPKPRAALDAGLRLIEHCALETYSVLTRLPPPHRVQGSLVRDFLAARFAGLLPRLNPRSYGEFVLKLPDLGVAGGAAYDALVAATAAANGAELVTCDRRALPVYETYDVQIRLLG
jgi:predicted nucleic acid-binding protein